MSSVDLLLTDAAEDAVPFSVRLAERRLHKPVPRRAERRAHARRRASDLDWLRSVRLTGGTGFNVTLIDLSEGGALIEVDGPLRPGLKLTLELAGVGLETSVPLQVVRSYIASLRGELTLYRGACAFDRHITFPEQPAHRVPGASAFVGIDAALTYLLEQCAKAEAGAASDPDAARVRLHRTDILQILESLRSRQSAGAQEPQNRYSAELLSAILPGLHRGTSREAVTAALARRTSLLPEQWQLRLAHTRRRLTLLIEQCLPPSPDRPRLYAADGEPLEARADATAPAEPSETTSFQKLVVRFADGRITKGYSQDFEPSRVKFSLWPSINATSDERIVVPIAELKAIFFVRDFIGNPAHRERKTFNARGHGRRLEVTFADGEVILGTTLSYRPDARGFFVRPADENTNNERIFVVAAAVKRVRFL